MDEILLDPLAPLLFRDGRPFGATGQGAESLPFPLPTTVAGALRTAWWEGQGVGGYITAVRDRLLALPAAGPLLAEANGDGWRPLLPWPADCLYVGEGEAGRVIRLVPGEPAKGMGCDLPAGLLPVVPETATKAKPARGAAFWYGERMAAWLRGEAVHRGGLGRDPLPIAVRTHVSLGKESLTADEGRLFETMALDFGPQTGRDAEVGGERYGSRVALLARFAEPLEADHRTLGGERRLARVTPVAGVWPALPEALAARLTGAHHLRLTLATPAPFAKGWLPGWLDGDLTGSPPPCPGLTLRLRAAVLGRWLPHSGWDLVHRDGRPGGAPRAVRRLVPAGAVYWFDVVAGGLDATAVEALWLAPLADGDQDRRDGFGLGLPGVWSPAPRHP
jgi:CRISPR-associated protein Cmr3